MNGHTPLLPLYLPIITVFIFGLIFLSIVYTKTLSTDTTLHVCDVGQGLALYLRIHNRLDVLYDVGASDQKILTCLGDYMPFFDKTIELIIISHNDKDHVGAIGGVLSKYYAKRVIGLGDSEFFNLSKKEKNNIGKRDSSQAGDTFVFENSQLRVLWPYKQDREREDIKANEISIVGLYTEQNFSILLPGDISTPTFEKIPNLQNVDILQVPHYGSASGLNSKLLKLLRPGISIISAGKNNRYGHPAATILDLLNSIGTTITRTDVHGSHSLVLNKECKCILQGKNKVQ